MFYFFEILFLLLNCLFICEISITRKNLEVHLVVCQLITEFIVTKVLEWGWFTKSCRKLFIVCSFISFQKVFLYEIVCKDCINISWVFTKFWIEAVLYISQEHLQHIHEKLSYLSDKHSFVFIQLIFILVGKGIIKLGNLVVFEVHDCSDVSFFVLNFWKLHFVAFISETTIYIAHSHVTEARSLDELFKLVKIFDKWRYTEDYWHWRFSIVK